MVLLALGLGLQQRWPAAACWRSCLVWKAELQQLLTARLLAGLAWQLAPAWAEMRGPASARKGCPAVVQPLRPLAAPARQRSLAWAQCLLQPAPVWRAAELQLGLPSALARHLSAVATALRQRSPGVAGCLLQASQPLGLMPGQAWLPGSAWLEQLARHLMSWQLTAPEMQRSPAEAECQLQAASALPVLAVWRASVLAWPLQASGLWQRTPDGAACPLMAVEVLQALLLVAVDSARAWQLQQAGPW